MAQRIEPFHRITEAQAEQAGWPRQTLRMMQVHFTLVGLALLFGAVALFGYLYSLEFERVEISYGLRITRAGDSYEADFQLKVIGVLLLVAASVIQLRAVSLLVQRRRGGLWLGRVAAAMLLAGLPTGVLLWIFSGTGDTEGVLAQVVSELSLVVRLVAGLLVFQALLGVWYIIASFSRPLRRICRVQTAWGNPLLRRAEQLGVLVALVVIAGLAVGLGVLTDWVYEVPVPDPEPGELLYATSFEALNSEWDLFPGRDSAQVKTVAGVVSTYELAPDPALVGDALVIAYGAGISDEVIWSAVDRKFSDFDLRVTARMLEGPVDQNQFGVIFRYRDPNNFYIFRITADGYYSLVKVEDGVQDKISDWGLSDAIRQGNASNEMRILGLGDTFRFFVNGSPVPLCLRGENETSMWANWEGPGICFTDETHMVYEDGSFRQGQIALAAGTIDGSDVKVAFDDLVIVGPEPSALIVINE